MSQTGRKTSALSPSMSVLFLLLLMKPCYAKSLACIASVVQQLLQTPLVVLIDIYFEIDNKNTDSASYNDYFVYALHC